MFRTVSSRALGIYFRAGQSTAPLEFSASLYSAQHRINVSPHSFVSRSPFPTAASSISTRLFHGQQYPLFCSAGRTRVVNRDDVLDDVDFASSKYVDFDETIDFDSVPRSKGPPPPSRDSPVRSVGDGGGDASGRGVNWNPRDKNFDRRSARSFDDDSDEPLGLNRRQGFIDDDDDYDYGNVGSPRLRDNSGPSDSGTLLPESVTTLLTSLRSQATTHNEELITSRSEHAASDVSFDDFGLESALVARLKQLDYGTPFEIQAKTMKALMDGSNVVGQAVTGSGKTLAFGIPLVNAMIKSRGETKGRRPSSQPKALILTPTRELCNQITTAISELDKNVKCLSLYGGRPLQSDIANLRRGVDVVCATPGRLRDHIQRKSISLEKLEFLVLDEADEMLKESWITDLEDILEGSPPEKQAILFSATMPPEIYDVAENFLQRKLEVIRVKDEESDDNAPSAVNHLSLYVPRFDHTRTVKEIIDLYDAKSTIVFVPTRAGTSAVCQQIRRLGMRDVETLQGGMSQLHRDRVLDGFRNGKFSVLVATDVAARGLDIPDVELIVQIGLPNGLPAYLHRSGRTGRAGKAGLALLIHSATKQELDFVRDLRRKVKNLKEEELAPMPQGRPRSMSDGGFQRRDHSNDNYRSGNRFGNDRNRFGGRDSGYYGGGRGGDLHRRDDRSGYGGRQRGGSVDRFPRRNRDSDDVDDDHHFHRSRGFDGRNVGRGGGGGFERDRRSGRNDRIDDLLDDGDDDSFGREQKHASSSRRDNSANDNNQSWVQEGDLSQNFKSFLAERRSGGRPGGARGKIKRDDDDDFW